MKKVIEFIFNTPSKFILWLFTVQAILFIWYDFLKTRQYPEHFDFIFGFVLVGVSLHNWLKHSRFMGMK